MQHSVHVMSDMTLDQPLKKKICHTNWDKFLVQTNILRTKISPCVTIRAHLFNTSHIFRHLSLPPLLLCHHEYLFPQKYFQLRCNNNLIAKIKNTCLLEHRSALQPGSKHGSERARQRR